MQHMIGRTWLILLLLRRFSRVRLCATPQTAAHEALPSLGFSRQGHWSGLPFPSPQSQQPAMDHLLTFHCPKQATCPNLIPMGHKIQLLGGKGRKLLGTTLLLKRLPGNMFIQTTDCSVLFFTRQQISQLGKSAYQMLVLAISTSEMWNRSKAKLRRRFIAAKFIFTNESQGRKKCLGKQKGKIIN